MSTNEYPTRRCGLTKDIIFDGASRVSEEKYMAKVFGFNTQVVLKHRPAGVANEVDMDMSASPIPRAFHLQEIPFSDGIPTTLSRSSISTSLRWLNLNKHEQMPILGNADGDEIWFVYKGFGTCKTILGSFQFTPGDFIRFPRGCYYQFNVTPDTRMIGVEDKNQFLKPRTGDWLNPTLPYNPNDLVLPKTYTGHIDADKKKCVVYIKRLMGYHKIILPSSPFTAIGWDGDVYPFLLPANAIKTVLVDSEHTDPTAFTIFATEDRSVCVSVFLPRLLHSPPYFHMNNYDEFIFYAGEYEAHAGIVGSGDLTFHPVGCFHGPHPQMLEKFPEPKCSNEQEWVDNGVAVMIEFREPSNPNRGLMSRQIPYYYKTFLPSS
jgi:homogentisate 1,2-dioxygenase